MITALEASLTECEWCWTGKAFTTIKEGYGFVIYRDRHQMWLAGLPPETVRSLRECHHDKGMHITGFWTEYHGALTKRMFEIPASVELLSHVVLSACPELPR